MAALEIWPDERSIMHRLLELLSETRQWKQSVALLIKLAEQTEPEYRAPYYVAAGNILAEEMDAVPEAVDVYERALDADPNDLKTFERIDTLVTATRDWKTQERTYRRQIKRMGHGRAAREAPGDAGALARAGRDLPDAAQGLPVGDRRVRGRGRAGSRIDRAAQDPRRAVPPATVPRRYAKAIAEHRALVQRAATPAEMAPELKTMLRLFVEMGALDEAHAAASVLVGAGPGRPRRGGAVPAVPAARRDSRARAADRGAVAAAPLPPRRGSRAVADAGDAERRRSRCARAKLPKDLGLKRKNQRNVITDQTVVCKAFAYGAQVFGMQPPDVYLVPESSGDIDVVNVRGGVPGVATLVIGRKLFETESDIELAFIVGRTLAAIRPDHLLRWPNFVPTLAELEIAVRAAIRLVDPERPIPRGADVRGRAIRGAS